MLLRTQTSLPAFPATVELLRLRPDSATRQHGHLLVLNDGAVNLSVESLHQLTQISPAQVPLDAEARHSLAIDKRQVFAFRFAGLEDALVMRAEPIEPEIAAQAVTLHHLGLNSATLKYELQLDIREAPIREFSLRLPEHYSLVSADGRAITDSIIKETENGPSLNLLFDEPLSGVQRFVLLLENNHPPASGSWKLPTVQPLDVVSNRGYVGLVLDDGLKAAAGATEGLREIIPEFFPVKLPDLQLAWRIQESPGTAAVQLERLEASLQAEAFHLHSIAGNRLYGSTILTYQITGAPIQGLQVEVPPGYTHVDFSGADLRDWREVVAGTYQLNLHGPIAGSWSLLVTYEIPLAGDGPVDCTGIRPLAVKSENGYIAFVSPHQAELGPVERSDGLIPLERAELPPDYRLLLDAPQLAAFHYTERPIQLKLGPTLLPRQASLDQVLEFSEIETSLTKDGEILHTAEFVLKSKNAPHFAFRLPPDSRLWEVLVGGATTMVSQDGENILIPLPEAGTLQPLHLTLKYATTSAETDRFVLSSPTFAVPSLQSQWTITADPTRRLELLSSAIPPETPIRPTPGGWRRLWASLTGAGRSGVPRELLFALPMLALLGGLCLHRARISTDRGYALPLAVGGGMCLLIGLAVCLLIGRSLWNPSKSEFPRTVAFASAFLEADQNLQCAVAHRSADTTGETGSTWFLLLPAIFLPPVGRWWLQRFRSSRWARAASAAWLTLLLGGLMLLPQGPTLVFVAAGMHFFIYPLIAGWPRHGPKRNPASNLASATAALAIIGFASCPHPGQAALIDYENIDRYILHTPLHLRIQLEDDVVRFETEFIWSADRDDRLPILGGSAVLVELDYPERKVTLLQEVVDGDPVYVLQAEREGQHRIHLMYQEMPVLRDDVWSCWIASVPSLYYTAEVRTTRERVTLDSPEAVGRTVLSTADAETTRVQFQLPPHWDLKLDCAPRSRDPRLEETVYYAESVHAYTPLAGTLQGEHELRLRLAQGRLRTVSLDLPADTTVVAASAPWMENWRFDPARSRLEVTAKEGLTAYHTLHYTTQSTTAALPYEFTLATPRCPGAQAETGWIGLSTPTGIQLDDTRQTGSPLALIGLADFPAANRDEELTLRRAWRYSGETGAITGHVSAVQPELRVTTEQLTSLGDDRLLHRVTLHFQVLRSGIFEARIAIPRSCEIESLSGSAVSHWTEQRGADERIATLYFKNRTLGATTAYLNLTGPGVREAGNWSPPKVRMLGASKESGQLILAPELGLRLQLRERQAASPIDPAELSRADRHRMAFRLLSADWHLAFDLEPVAPWLEGSVLQDLTAKPGLVETVATAQYTIKNAGIKSLRLRLPPEAIAVRIEAPEVASVSAVTDDPGLWQVELERRVIDRFALQIRYQEILATGSRTIPVSGIQLLDTSVQQSYCALRGRQRLRLQPGDRPATFAATEWKQIPEELRHAASEPAQLVWRTAERAFSFAVEYDRLETAQVLPAQIHAVELQSVLAHRGLMLTSARFELDPGHKRDLHLTLPPGSEFWSGRINREPVWPARTDGQLLIPLTPAPSGEPHATVEVLYATRFADEAPIAEHLVTPQCDLPLENIRWSISVPDDVPELEWEGDLDLVHSAADRRPRKGLESLLAADRAAQSEQLANAEQLLRLGQSLAEKGDPDGARNALASAYSISQYDESFNEDARVQLENLKIQQAMVGLTNRRNQLAPSAFAPVDAGRFSSGDAEELLNTVNTADDNTALAQLAARFLEHQSSGFGPPSDLHATLPPSGRNYRFERRLLAQPWQALELHGTSKEAASGSFAGIALMLGGTLLLGALSAPRISGTRK